MMLGNCLLHGNPFVLIHYSHSPQQFSRDHTLIQATEVSLMTPYLARLSLFLLFASLITDKQVVCC